MAGTGILGGTFDPPHLGHLLVAESARDGLGLDRVLLVVTPQSPFKTDRDLTAFDVRAEMVRAAIAGSPGLELSPIEAEREGPHYTVDTLALLHERRPEALPLTFIVGSDSALQLRRWRDPRRLLDLARLAVVPRPGFNLAALNRLAEGPDAPATRAEVEAMKRNLAYAPQVEISSRDIRRRVREGHSIRYLMPDAVRAIIEARGLYRD